MRTKKQIKECLEKWEKAHKHYDTQMSETTDERKYNYTMESFTRNKVKILRWVLEDKNTPKPEVFETFNEFFDRYSKERNIK